MKVSELEGAHLDYWVAKADGCKIVDHVFEEGVWHARDCGVSVYYSRDWVEGGPIIERECISLVYWEKDSWGAYVGRQGAYFDVYPCDNEGSGSTALVAAMRAYVTSKFGDEVPDENISASQLQNPKK